MPPTLPTLEEMRGLLRIGMTRFEFFTMLDELAERPGGLQFGGEPNVVSLPVAEGGKLLCFIADDKLVYVEYEGGIFLDFES